MLSFFFHFLTVAFIILACSLKRRAKQNSRKYLFQKQKHKNNQYLVHGKLNAMRDFNKWKDHRLPLKVFWFSCHSSWSKKYKHMTNT